MKEHLKKIVLNLLTFLARKRLQRLRPFIIGVTGSVGKTSTKDAIYTILGTRYKVVRNEKSYNSEFGLPLAILEMPSGFSSAMKWLTVISEGMWNAFLGGHGLQMMVLEMGADHPGDMDRLLGVIHPQIAVMTAIKPVHLAEGQFKDLEDIALEKSKLAKALPERGTAIINGDDPYFLPLKDTLLCKKIFYGFSDACDLKVKALESNADGLHFILTYQNQLGEASLALAGKFNIYVVLAAAAAALTQGFTLQEALDALKDFKLPAGRMNLIPGIFDTTIIDSSYNASPETVKEALGVLQEVARNRKIAVLGNMNELGVSSEAYHRIVGRNIAGKTDILVTVGDCARWIGDEAQRLGFPQEAILHYSDANEAADQLKTFLQKGDTILVKGSQNNVRLERLVRKLMRDPSHADEMLVRQDEAWQKVA